MPDSHAIWRETGGSHLDNLACISYLTRNLEEKGASLIPRRFLCHYSPSATSPALALVGSGPDPVVPQWAEQLNGLKSKGDEVAFGYGEFKGKGCVIHYLTDKMG